LFLGFAIVGALFSRRNLLQSALLAPVTGMGATMLLVAMLNWVLPVRYAGPLATLVLAVLSVWLIRRKRVPVSGRLVTPFAGVLLLAALVTGYPFFRFGFNWVSYCNDDMANYCLSAKFLLNHNQWTQPAAQDILTNKDTSLYYWYFDVLSAMRHGVDELLAWVLSLTGLASLQAFMPTILAFQLVLISAAGALVMQGRKYRRAALLTCFAMAFSALIALGSVYQLFGQVGGLAALCGAAAVLLRRVTGLPKSERVLAGLLLSSLGLLYPEVLPFLAFSYFAYHFLCVLRRKERLRDVLATLGPIGFYWLTFVNVSAPCTIATLLRQTVDGTKVKVGAAGLFPYYMTPGAFAYLWGFWGISEAPVGIGLDLSIVSGALLLLIVLIGSLVYAWKLRPVAFFCPIMLALALVLFARGVEFGVYKLAMYVQPFLIGSIALILYGFWDAAPRSVFRRALLASALVAVIGFGARSQFFYVQRSLGLDGGGLVEIPFASIDGLIAQLEALPPKGGITIADTSNIVAMKFESAYRSFLYMPTQDVYSSYIHLALEERMDPVYWFNKGSVSKLSVDVDKRYQPASFAMHGALPQDNGFSIDVPVSGNRDFALLESGTQSSVLNRLTKSPNRTAAVRLTSTSDAPNHLVFISSQFGGSFYAKANRLLGQVSMYQVEPDFFYPGSTMQSLGRISLFRVLDPSPQVRLFLEFTSSLNADGRNLIPAAGAIGAGRAVFHAVGRGSGRLISPPITPQRIAGGDYVLLDMGTWGTTFVDRRSALMRLWGREHVTDNRRIVGFSRDISLMSSEQYDSIRPPSAVQTFPRDLKDKNLEYSGIYEDGWVAEASELVLQPDEDATHLIATALVPSLNGSRTASWAALDIDGAEIARKTIDSNAVTFDVPFAAKGRRRIGLRFDRSAALPSPDTRPVSAQLRYAGFVK
jgi:hypothetical protein